MPDTNDKKFDATKILGIAITGLLAVNTFMVSNFENQFKQAESERNVNFRIYDSLADAVESSDTQKIRAVRVLVNNLASDDLKTGFLEVLEQAEIEIYKQQEALVERAEIPEPQPAPDPDPSPETTVDPTPSFNWGNWKYDIFWCSGSGAGAEALANALVDDIIKDGAAGRIRSRILPESVKAQSGYSGVNGFQIRYEDNELSQAETLQEFAAKTTGINFTLNKINPKTKTSGYISAFICPKI